VAEPPEPVAALVGHQRGELEGRLRRGKVCNAPTLEIVIGPLGRATDFAAAPLLPPLAPGLVHRLTPGDDHQQPPQVVAVVESGIAAPGGAPAEVVKGAEGGVLLVGDGPSGPAEPGARQPDEGLEVALPELLGSVGFSRLEG